MLEVRRSSTQRAVRRLDSVPLEQSLQTLGDRLDDPHAPVRGLTKFARSSLGLEGSKAGEWSRRASWSWAAGHLVQRSLAAGRVDEVLALVDPFDLDEALGAGHGGTLLAGAHIGAPKVARLALAAHSTSMLALIGAERGVLGEGDMVLDSEDKQRKQTIVATLHLRRGGELYGAPDGRRGAAEQVVQLLGHDVQLKRGLPALARGAHARTVFVAALWTGGNRLRIGFGGQLEPPAKDAPPSAQATWAEQWFKAWATWFSTIIEEQPENARLFGGLWRSSPGGLLR